MRGNLIGLLQLPSLRPCKWQAWKGSLPVSVFETIISVSLFYCGKDDISKGNRLCAQGGWGSSLSRREKLTPCMLWTSGVFEAEEAVPIGGRAFPVGQHIPAGNVLHRKQRNQGKAVIPYFKVFILLIGQTVKRQKRDLPPLFILFHSLSWKIPFSDMGRSKNVFIWTNKVYFGQHEYGNTAIHLLSRVPAGCVRAGRQQCVPRAAGVFLLLLDA